MTNDIKVFDNKEFGKVRTTMINGEPWFIGKDVAESLGYKDTSDALKRHVDEEDKLTRCFTDSGQSREMYIINESGLYSLVLSSKLLTAKKFKRWITHEVIPSIRKTGGYVANDELFISTYLPTADEATKLMFRTTLATVRQLNEDNNKLLQTVSVQNQQIAEMEPKVTYYDIVLQCKDVITITTIAKDYGKSAKWMNQYLHDKGVQYRQGDIWLLYQKYASKGYTHTKTYVTDTSAFAKVHTYWTQKGRLFIYDLLKSDGILPLIEQEEQNEN